jgi:hypothetical protein
MDKKQQRGSLVLVYTPLLDWPNQLSKLNECQQTEVNQKNLTVKKVCVMKYLNKVGSCTGIYKYK